MSQGKTVQQIMAQTLEPELTVFLPFRFEACSRLLNVNEILNIILKKFFVQRSLLGGVIPCSRPDNEMGKSK